jgi:hypothetical protein
VFTPDELERLADLPAAAGYESLNLLACPLTPRTLVALRRFPRLERVGLNGQSATPADVVRLAADHPNLRDLAFSDPPALTAAAADAVAGLPLVELTLNRLPDLPPGFGAKLAGMPGLRYASLAHTTALTEDQLAGLAKSRSLRTLILRDTKLTDARLAALDPLAGLTRLQIDLNPRLSEAAVKAFAAAHPRCRVEWDGGVLGPLKD